MREFTDYADFDQTWNAAVRGNADNGFEFDQVCKRACQALEFELAGPTFEELADLYQVEVAPLDMDAYWDRAPGGGQPS
jgi:hypothetical protein